MPAARNQAVITSFCFFNISENPADEYEAVASSLGYLSWRHTKDFVCGRMALGSAGWVLRSFQERIPHQLLHEKPTHPILARRVGRVVGGGLVAVVACVESVPVQLTRRKEVSQVVKLSSVFFHDKVLGAGFSAISLQRGFQKKAGFLEFEEGYLRGNIQKTA